MVVKMFDVFYANLSKDTVNSEQGGTRPVVIVQNNTGNKYSPTVIVIPITSEIKKINLPTHAVIRKSRENGLYKDSMVVGEQLRTIDKSRLSNKIGHIDNENEQKHIINAYIANITGKNRYSSIWLKFIDKLFRLVKGEEYGNAA